MLPLITLAFCSYFMLAFLFAVFANYWPGPIVDYWIDIPNVEKFFTGQLTFHDLVSAHANVHRLLIPRLLFIADYRFFAGSNTLLVWASIACKAIMLLLFNHIFRDQSLRSKLLLNMLLFAAILNVANLSNVLHNSNMQWDLVSLFACLAIYFYSRDCHSSDVTRLRSIALAWLFFTCAFFSQAGALPVLFVFVFISLLNKKWFEAFFNVTLALLVLYLTFVVLPVNEPEKPTYESAVAMMLFKLKYVALYVFKMFSGSIYPLDHSYFVFSWCVLLLFIVSLAFAHKTKAIYHNVFLSIALFAFLMMIIIAAARVDFAPNTWSANRYQTNVLVFILSLTLHGYFSVATWFSQAFSEKYKTLAKNTILSLSLTSFLITQHYLDNYAFVFGNKILLAQSYMLTHGVNQNNGADLLLSLQEQDRIAIADPFFRQHGFAWYANKQAGNGFYQHRKNTGELFFREGDKPAFIHTCTINNAPVEYSRVTGAEGLEFSSVLDTRAPIPRNTYYVLDTNGVVIGFSTVLINTEHFYTQSTLTGYVTSASAQYIADINKAGHARCLYALEQNQ